MTTTISAVREAPLCARAQSRIHSYVDELLALGFEVELTLTPGESCGYPERHCETCGSATFRLDMLPGSEYSIVSQLLTEQIELHSLDLIKPLLPSLLISQQANHGEWVTVLKFYGLRTVGRSTSLHYADLKALIDLVELLKDSQRSNPLPSRKAHVADIISFVQPRVRPDLPVKGILIQAVSRVCPDHPVVQRNTSGGSAHMPVFVVELEWMGYHVMQTGSQGQSRRAVEEAAYAELFEGLRVKLRGGAASDDDCPICLNPLGEPEECVEYPCGHALHEECSLQHRAALVSGPVERPLFCPQCRRAVDLGDAENPPRPVLAPAEFAPVTMNQNRSGLLPHRALLARLLADDSILGEGAGGAMPTGPVFGNIREYPCGLAAVLCMIAAAGELTRTYGGILLDHAAILRAEEPLTPAEKRARMQAAANERQAAAIRLWRELGYGRRVTPSELAVVVTQLNLSVGIVALGGIMGPNGLQGVGLQRLLRRFACATGRVVLGHNGNEYRPCLDIIYVPGGNNGAMGHFFALDFGRAYERKRRALAGRPVPPVYEPRMVDPGMNVGGWGVPPADWAVYLGAVAHEAATIAAAVDGRNNRYDAAAAPGFLEMAGNRIHLARPIAIADVGGDFADVPRAPAAEPPVMEPEAGFIPVPGVDDLVDVPGVAMPEPERPPMEFDDFVSPAGFDEPFPEGPPPEPVEPAPLADADPEPAPEPEALAPPQEVVVEQPLPFDMQDAVLVSTVTCDALPCFWVKVPSPSDTRRVHRWARDDVCTCHFSFFQVVPCKHIRRAKVLILGPGFERALCGNMVVGLGLLWFKEHYYAQMHEGNFRLTTHKGRAYWVDPAGFRTNQPVLVNPPGQLVGLHYGPHPVPLDVPTVVRSPPLQDGSWAHLVRPVTRASYWEIGPAVAIESLCHETSIIQGLKGGALGAVFGYLCDVVADPTDSVFQLLISSWNAQAAAMHLPALKITFTAATLTCKVVAAWIVKVLVFLHVPFLGQAFLIGFLGLLVKVGLYRLFRRRLDIGGPWADLGFLSTYGLHAIPVMLVRWMLTPGVALTLDYGTDHMPLEIPGAQPEVVAASAAVAGYANTRALTDPGIFRAAATGLINFNRAGHMLPPHLFEQLVAIEAENCFHRVRLEGEGFHNSLGEFHGIVPPRGCCLNYPHCQRKLDKVGRRRNFSLCSECLRSHCNRPGRECQNEYVEALFDGVRFTGQIPLVCFRSHYYEPPDQTEVFIPPGCSLITNMGPGETRHPDFCVNRKIGVGVGFLHPGWTVDHQHSGISAVVMGLMERTFQYGEPYDERAVDRYCAMVDYIATRTPDGLVDAMEDAAWIETQERKLVLGPAMRELRHGDGLLKKDLEIGVFSKSEWFCKTKPGLGIFGPSKRRAGYKKRGIYTPQDKAHCAVGPSAKPMQAHIASVFHAQSPFFYAGKANPAELNNYLQRLVEAEPYSYVLMADIARCETNKHFRVVDARMGYYRRKWSVVDEVRDRVIMSWKNARFKARNRQGRCSGRLPPNMTLSGEDFTSADNSFDVAIATHLLVYCALENVPPSQMTDAQFDACCRLWESGDVFGAGSGDDTTVVIPRIYRGQHVDKDQYLETYQRYAIELGFKVTGLWSRAVWDIVFLGMRPYHCSDGLYRFGRLIGRSSVKNHCARQLEGHPYDWLMEVCKAEVNTMPHVPLLYHKARRVLDVLQPRLGTGRPLRKNDLHRLKKEASWLNVDGHGVTFTEQTWRDLGECYGLSVESLKSEVDRINKANWFPYALSGEVWDRIFTVDLGY